MDKNTHVPDELLLNLKHAQAKTATINQQVQKPDSAWHFKKQQQKLKHLTDYPTHCCHEKKLLQTVFFVTSGPAAIN